MSGLEEMPLQKLRSARNLTQENLAKVLRVKQAEVSKIERRADLYVSTLASYVKAMGGTLEVRAAFPDGAVVKIDQFEELDGKTAKRVRGGETRGGDCESGGRAEPIRIERFGLFPGIPGFDPGFLP